MQQIRVAVVICDPAQIAPGPLRLLDFLAGDVRFQLAAVFSAAGRTLKSPLQKFLLSVEDALLPEPEQFVPAAFQAARPPLTFETLEAGNPADEAEQFDVVIDFSHDAQVERLAPGAAHGVWRLSPYEPHFGWRDLIDQNPVSRAVLSRLDASKGTWEIIAEAAYNPKISIAHHLAFVREKSVQLVIRELKRVALGGSPNASKSVHTPESPAGVFPVISYGLRFGRQLGSRLKEKLQDQSGRRPGMWMPVLGKGDPLQADPLNGKKITPEGNTYWADPFLYEHQGELYVFFELYDYSESRGSLAVGKWDGSNLKFLGPVMERDCHLSFPYVFSHDGDIYMLPETNETARVEIWKCKSFPFEWELHATALHGQRSADSVLTEIKGEWWLFTNITSDSFGDHCSDLHIFKVDGPDLTSVVPHALNPVVIDTTCARGGGRIFQRNEEWIRPAQNNSHGVYGYGLKLMRIDELSLETYSETLVRELTCEEDPSIMGCHHMDVAGEHYVFDVRKKTGGRPSVSSRKEPR